jgi:hypothetical protein
MTMPAKPRALTRLPAAPVRASGQGCKRPETALTHSRRANRRTPSFRREQQAAQGDVARLLRCGDWRVEMADTKKCAHPQCKCTVTDGGAYGKYCSEHCREAADQTELMCDCKHPGCR